jgi:D-sedoheptulose 7-phosphate isomerase
MITVYTATPPITTPTSGTSADYFSRLHHLLLNVSVSTGSGQPMSAESGAEEACKMLLALRKTGRKAIVVGNGGSAAIASHQALDLWHTSGIQAIAFNDSAQLTCLANDYGYEQVFSKAIEMFANAGDLLIAISSSGKSRSILNAVSTAREKDCRVITYSGFDRHCPLNGLGDLNFYIDSDGYGLVELAHMALIHHLTDMLTDKSKRTAE